MIIEIILALILPPVVYFLIEYIIHIMKIKDYPPGPFPLPVIGNLHLLKDESYSVLAKIYGNVFSISLGMNRFVIINTIEPAREALITKGNIFAGRPKLVPSNEMGSRGYKGMVFTDYGPTWKRVRKLAHSSLKMYGEGMTKLEALFIRSSEDMHLRIKKQTGKPVNFSLEIGMYKVLLKVRKITSL